MRTIAGFRFLRMMTHRRISWISTKAGLKSHFMQRLNSLAHTSVLEMKRTSPVETRNTASRTTNEENPERKWRKMTKRGQIKAANDIKKYNLAKVCPELCLSQVCCLWMTVEKCEFGKEKKKNTAGLTSVITEGSVFPVKGGRWENLVLLLLLLLHKLSVHLPTSGCTPSSVRVVPETGHIHQIRPKIICECMNCEATVHLS